MNWIDYQKAHAHEKPNYLAVYLANHFEFNRVIDLGCGSGNETIYFLKKGKCVIAVDAYAKEELILKRVPEKLKNNLHFIKETFEEVDLPLTDCIYSSFSLSFCEQEKFQELWDKIGKSLKKGGILAVNLFGKKDTHTKDIVTFSENEIKKLLKNYEILKWKEQEYNQEEKHFHYYDFVAQKK